MQGVALILAQHYVCLICAVASAVASIIASIVASTVASIIRFYIIMFYLPLLGSFYGVLFCTGHRCWSGGGVLRSGEGVMLDV